MVSNINIVEMQDSLQMLAKLPKLEQNAIIEFPLLNEEGGEVIFSLPQFCLKN